jgi:transcription antitermination factor NusG
MSDWCILRTANRSTLGLAGSLAKDGFTTWTPAETRSVRVPRRNVKREVRFPMLPSFVFARAAHLIDLLQLAEMPVKPRRGAGLLDAAHAAFHVMHLNDRIPVVADHDLANLRRIEARRQVRSRAPFAFPRDAAVRVKDGPFGGMTGVVVRSSEARTSLRFDGGWPVELPTLLLDRAELYANR